ncbi:cell pole-organizing protein PopZ [Ancylobacter sp. 3268]|uniref:PopZ family protein n=1 Tax=Ancylobacter sp. 3268 TaxID=2817752 RepID=UPI002856EC34|nr:DUF2497 domain-containing protein [Ancylobacter sp. 3268]MDR6953756.1 cell pole-organizing protein PopZ [Ancylobacter sp. 3268]
MSVSARANEPSMEEILASIRRIISDDVAGENEAARAASLVEPVDAVPAEDETAPELDDAPVPAAAEDSLEPPAEVTPAEVAPAEADAAPAAPVADSAAARPRPLPTSLRPVPRDESKAEAASPQAAPAAAAPALSAAAPRADLTHVERTVHAELDGLAGSLHAQVMAAVTRSVESLAPKAFPETVDMQVQAKPAVVSSRVAPTLAERRTTEDAAAFVEASRSAEPRSLLARAEAESRPNRLLSGATGESVATSFSTLSRTVASNTRSMEDVVTDALRPMLKSWLDENLPELVERLVRAEIERVARHGQ